MTGIAKLLVFANVFFGVGLFSWGLSVYSNRVDWLDAKPGEGAAPVEGQITAAKKRITTLLGAIADAQSGPGGYGPRRAELLVAESRRDTRVAGFDKRLAQARGGRFRVQLTYADPYSGGVYTDLTKEGADVLTPSEKPLEGLDTLRDRFAAETRTIEGLLTGKRVQPDATWQGLRSGTLTLDDAGRLVPDLGINDLRRLHLELTGLIRLDEIAIDKQQFIRSNLADEGTFLAAARVNTIAELTAIEMRQRQLDARLKSFPPPAQR